MAFSRGLRSISNPALDPESDPEFEDQLQRAGQRVSLPEAAPPAAPGTEVPVLEPEAEPPLEVERPADRVARRRAGATGGFTGNGNPRDSFVGQLAAAHGAGGTGFQQFGSAGAAPFRTADFYRSWGGGDPEAMTPLRVGRGPTHANLSVGGEGDDEARAWRQARMAARLPF